MTFPRRVAMVTPRYAPAVGGIEWYVEKVSRGLTERGVEVEVVASDPTGTLARVERRGRVLVRRFRTVGNSAVYFVAPGVFGWLWRNTSRFSLVHAHSYHTPLALQAAIACRTNGVPFVLSPHYHGGGHSRFRNALHVPYRPLGKWMVRSATAVICDSNAERDLLEAHFGRMASAVVIPSAVDMEEIRAASPLEKRPGTRLVLAVGRLDRYKQHRRAIEAVTYLPPEYELVVIGDGPNRSALEVAAAAPGVAGRVRLLRPVPRADLLRWYRTADVFVTLSLREAFGIAVLEAGASGPAIIASDIPAHREVASYLNERRVAFVPVDCSARELAGAIEASVSRAATAVPGGAGMPSLRSWSETLDAVLATYRDVLGRERRERRYDAK